MPVAKSPDLPLTIRPEKLLLPPCPTCGRRDATPIRTTPVFADAPITYFRCSCGLVWTQPRG